MSERCIQVLGGLPAVLDMARTILMVCCPPEDEDAKALRGQIEECVVDAHRLLLKLKIGAPQGDADLGRTP